MKSWEVNLVEYGVGCRAIAGVVGHDVAMVIGGRFVIEEWCNWNLLLVEKYWFLHEKGARWMIVTGKIGWMRRR